MAVIVNVIVVFLLMWSVSVDTTDVYRNKSNNTCAPYIHVPFFIEYYFMNNNEMFSVFCR